ncbi:MAG: response regulator with CheY-like receiver, AAA-type ATPase, and DNA-binding domain [Deltaproteobacteria bacterium]|nr:response regulator with CheY-like receiver, AAA-type ATPase, and DNA-binding domain [Deltaproteobacteria bacterium]
MITPSPTGAPVNILVVDDESNIRKTLAICLETEGHHVTAVSNFQDAVAEASRRTFHMAFIDLRLGAASGLDLIPVLLSGSPWMKIIVITAYASIDTAVEAMRRGATDYIPKPFTPAQVLLAVRKVEEVRTLEQKVAALREDLERTAPEVRFSSESPGMQRAMEVARQVAPTDAAVLVRGESGTGKTVLARAIHGWSRRSGKPFGVVSCPSLPTELLTSELFGHVKGAFTGAVRDNPGRVAACEGGTLFLDEIGDLPLSLQPKLLRFLQDQEYERIGDPSTRKADVRIITATNRDLEGEVKAGRFREDLFYRLNVIQIEIPPLRERSQDLEALAKQLLAFYGRIHHRVFAGFTEEAMQAMKRHVWPGPPRGILPVGGGSRRGKHGKSGKDRGGAYPPRPGFHRIAAGGGRGPGNRPGDALAPPETVRYLDHRPPHCNLQWPRWDSPCNMQRTGEPPDQVLQRLLQVA